VKSTSEAIALSGSFNDGQGKENFERGQSSGVLNTHSTAHTEYDELSIEFHLKSLQRRRQQSTNKSIINVLNCFLIGRRRRRRSLWDVS
jgi:hypothetical protein